MQFECWISQRRRDPKSRKGGSDSADEHGFVLRPGDNEAADEHLILRQHAGPGRDVEERLRRVELRRVVQFRARKFAATEAAKSSCDKCLAVRKQRGRVSPPREDEAAGRTPGSAGRIVQFRARKNALEGALTACNKHLAVGKQCGGVSKPREDEAAGRTPSSARRIVQFRRRKHAVAVTHTLRAVALPCHPRHRAVMAQRRRVKTPRGAEAAARTPGSSRCILKVPAAAATSSHSHLAARKQCGRVKKPRCGEAAGRT